MRGSGPILVATSIPPRLARSSAGKPVDGEYQRLCVRSWLDCGFHVISVNHHEEISALAPQYPEITFIPTARDASSVTGRKNPLIADLVGALAAAQSSVVGIINSDIIFEPKSDWQSWLPNLTANNVVIGQRYDSNSLTDGAIRRMIVGFDYFFFSRDSASAVAARTPPFAIGVPWWDYWLPLVLALEGDGILVCERPAIFHLNHKSGWDWSAWRKFGLFFCDFVIANCAQDRPPAPACLAALAEPCRHIKEMSNSPEMKLADLDLQLTDLGALCVNAFRRNVVRLGIAPSDELPISGGLVGYSVAGPEPIADGISPVTVFAAFDRRLQSGQLMHDALQLEQQGNLPAAEARFRSGLENTPLDAEFLIHYGRFAFLAGSPQEHVAFFDRALAQHALPDRLMNQLGVDLFQRGRMDDAVRCFERALTFNPALPQPHYNLAAILRNTDRYGEAIRRFEKMLAENPDNIGGAELYWRLRHPPLPEAAEKPSAAPEYFGQNGEDALLDEFFNYKTQGFFVDVGAFDGIHLSNSYVFEKRGWSGLCVEPTPRYFELCAANRPGSQCRNVACTATSQGMVEFRFESGGLFSGVDADQTLVTGIFERAHAPFNGFKSIKVPSATLNDLLPAKAEIDFVSIDVEGSELDVLAGFDLEQYKPRILLIEASTDQQRQSLDDYLAPRGYHLARSILWNHFYVRTEEDRLALRAIIVSAKLGRPPHPLGSTYNYFGYSPNPFVFWPAAA